MFIFDTTEVNEYQDLIERALWRIFFRLALLGPDVLHDVLRHELPLIKQWHAQWKDSLGHISSGAETSTLIASSAIAKQKARETSEAEDCDRSPLACSVATMKVNQFISSEVAKISNIPRRKRANFRKKKKGNARKTKAVVVDLTGSKEDSDFLKALNGVSPDYWTSILTHTIPKQEKVGKNMASEYSDTSKFSGSDDFLFLTLAIGE